MKLKKPPVEKGVKLTLDIEVEGTHTYQYANGVVSHNTVGKVMAATEGGHLPPVDYYLRWVLISKDSDDHRLHEKMGYPIRDVSHKYAGYVIVGFPTRHPIVNIMGDDIVTTEDTTIEQQYQFLRLFEKYWLGGDNNHNNLSVTLKYDPKKVSFDQFMTMILTNQPTIRCAAIMPQIPSEELEEIYGYQPEEKITKTQYNAYMEVIGQSEKEIYDNKKLTCEGGACGVDEDRVVAA